MKTKTPLLILGIAIFISLACNKTGELNLNNAYSGISEDKKELIVADINKSLNPLIDGIVSSNAAKIFSIFSTNSNTVYIRDGHMYPKVEEAEKQYANWFKNSTEKKKFYFKTQNLEIINDSTALFTAIGVLEELNTDKDPWKIAYTIMWINEENGWKAIHMHTSWE